MEDQTQASTNATDASLNISSPEFSEGGSIPASYTCKGQNINPPLNITGVPNKALSLALILHDPDAVNGDFVHWLVWDIPTSTKNIATNSAPVGAIQGANGTGQPKYMGPCPPAGTGTHRYMFELYVLNTTLGLKSGSSRTDLEKAMQGHILAKKNLTGLFAAD